MQIDKDNWSGDGDFTGRLLAVLRGMASVDFLRVEDAPASRSDASFSFISNEIFVRFRQVPVPETVKVLGLLPVTRHVLRPALTLVDLEAHLTMVADVGAPDYSDDGMLQYLRTERIIPPYQTKGYKVVELLRVYQAGTPSRAGDPAV